MANAFLNTLIEEHLIFNTPLSRKISTLSKNFADENTHQFQDIVQKFSPAEQRFWCLVRIKHAMKHRLGVSEIKNASPTYQKLYKDLEEKLGRTKKYDEQVSNAEFKTILNTYADLVIEFLHKDLHAEDLVLSQEQLSLLEELQIQETEFKSANRKKLKSLIIKGLFCLALSTASVILITLQGSVCTVLSLPMALLGASYGMLAYEVDPITALSNAMSWVKHLSEHKQANGMAALFLFGAGYYHSVKTDPFLEELFKSAQHIFPAIPKQLLGIASAAAVPPLYFFNQYKKFSSNTQLMDDLFEKEEIAELQKIRI